MTEDFKPETQGAAPSSGAKVGRAVIYFGFVVVAAGITYAVVRGALARPPADPTAERIRVLIEEANRLLKELDDKRSG